MSFVEGCGETNRYIPYHTLPKTHIFPKHRPGPKRKQVYSNHQFFSVSFTVPGKVALYRHVGDGYIAMDMFGIF